MNCHKIQRQVLLLGSGELHGRRRAWVEAHLQHCAACAAYQRDAEQVTELGRRSGHGVDGPSAYVLTRIRAHAGEAACRRPLVVGRPVLQAACAALLLLGAAWWALSPDGKEPGVSGGGGEMYALVDIMSTLENTSDRPSIAADEADLQGLAERLLQLQGFAEEDISVEEWWEPSPTTPLSHSTPAPSARRCG